MDGENTERDVTGGWEGGREGGGWRAFKDELVGRVRDDQIMVRGERRKEQTSSKVGGKSDKDGIDSGTTGRVECDKEENDVCDKAE